MNRTLRSSLISSGVLAFAVLGCNAILDNEAGVPMTVDETTLADAASSPDEPVIPPADGGTTAPDSGDKPSADCAAGQQLCFGTCVSLTDPAYGCGAASCAPCKSNRSTMGCQGRTCVVAACDPGYSDCNATAADGCEKDLSKAASCGTCNAACAAAAPLCAPAGPTFQCTNGCTPAAPLNCGAECVDPNLSTNHCGGCNIQCPVVENGTSVCGGGACSFTCKPQFHACAGACPVRTDPATCGPACTPCPAPAGGTATCVNDVCGTQCPATSRLCGGACVAKTDPGACGAACVVCVVPLNAAATCVADACGFTCTAGFGNCDANPVNGCEANLATDSAHCGVCGMACGVGLTCVDSVCQ